MARPRAVGTGAYQDARQYHKARLSQIREQAVLVAGKNSGCKQQARVSSRSSMSSPGEVSSTPGRSPVVSAIQIDDGTLATIIEGVTARVQGAMDQADLVGEANWGMGKGGGMVS